MIAQNILNFCNNDTQTSGTLNELRFLCILQHLLRLHGLNSRASDFVWQVVEKLVDRLTTLSDLTACDEKALRERLRIALNEFSHQLTSPSTSVLASCVSGSCEASTNRVSSVADVVHPRVANPPPQPQPRTLSLSDSPRKTAQTTATHLPSVVSLLLLLILLLLHRHHHRRHLLRHHHLRHYPTFKSRPHHAAQYTTN